MSRTTGSVADKYTERHTHSLTHTLASQRAPVGLPVGIGVFGLGINWPPAGATDTEGLHQWTEPGGEASACCGSSGLISIHTHRHKTHTQRLKSTQTTQKWKSTLAWVFTHLHTHPPSHTHLLSPLNSVWWPSILQPVLSAWGNQSDNRRDPKRSRLQQARRLYGLPGSSNTWIIELWVEVVRASGGVIEANMQFAPQVRHKTEQILRTEIAGDRVIQNSYWKF